MNINKIKIRKIENKDLKKLAEIYNQIYSSSIYDVGEKWTEESAHDMLDYWYKRNPELAFLAEFNGKIVGAFLVDVKPWWDGNHLVDGEIFIHPNYQKKGIGTKLSRFMFTYAIKKYDVIKWDTYTFKDKYPLKWYKSIGFSEIKEWAMISGDIKEILKKLK